MWNNFKDVIPAGGNSFYALLQDSTLIGYRHDGLASTSIQRDQQVRFYGVMHQINHEIKH